MAELEEKGMRFNQEKPKWSLVPQSSLLPMVRVLEFGAKKYASFNWMKGLSVTEICESLKRHLDAFMEGEDNDPESGISHIGHMQCNTLFLAWMMEHRPDLDDRFKGFNNPPEKIKYITATKLISDGENQSKTNMLGENID